MEIAPGIRRIGPGLVNCYLIEEAGEVTLIDAGLAGYWRELPRELAAMGRSLADVRALVLTHAHSDHVGFAERLRRERGTPVRVHAADAALARGEVKARGQSTKGFHLVPLLRFLVFAFRSGGARTEPIAEVATFDDGATLDVPGGPRAIHVPGHTDGSVALHLPSRDAIFIGDAIVTLNVLTGVAGPQIGPFNADEELARRSLARLGSVDARLVLPGHGLPWTNGLSEALHRAAVSGPRA